MECSRWAIEMKLSSNLHQDLGNPIQRELDAACLRKARRGREHNYCESDEVGFNGFIHV